MDMKQQKIWQKNLKKGYRFFQPDNAFQPTPRTQREADMQRHLKTYER